jgi:hypothetical protein
VEEESTEVEVVSVIVSTEVEVSELKEERKVVENVVETMVVEEYSKGKSSSGRQVIFGVTIAL